MHTIQSLNLTLHMKSCTPTKVLFLFSLLFLFSCAKDTDLLAERVLLDPDVVLRTYVVNDSYQVAITPNNEEETVDVTVRDGIGNINNDQFELNSNISIELDVLANDTFENVENVTLFEVTQPANGTVQITSENTLIYTPSFYEQVVVTFTYTVQFDMPNGTQSSANGNVTVSINGPTSDTDSQDMGALKAFPSAYGAASHITGGRGMQVVRVTNLNDSGPGSFRDAWGSNRVIVFDVSGTIQLNTAIVGASSNVTVAGQTAPAGGITFTGNPGSGPLFSITGANNVIFRYVKWRRAYFSNHNTDAFQCNDCNDVIIDHCSVSWGGDEAIDFPGTSSNITVQYTLMAESETGTTAGNVFSTGSNYSCLRNMFVNVSHRTPYYSAVDQVDIINNVVHNWYSRAAISAANDNTLHNYIGNYLQPGQVGVVSTGSGGAANAARNWIDVRDQWGPNNPSIYSYNNYWPGVSTNPNQIDYNPLWVQRFALTTGSVAGTPQFAEGISPYSSTTQFPLLGDDIPILGPIEAKQEVENNVGANAVIDGSGNVVFGWDSVDNVYINQVKNNDWVPYSYPINPTGYPHYINFFATVSATPINAHPQNYDTDNDGMPDSWELSRFGNLSTSNRATDTNADGWTDLEDYLNLVDF